LDFEKGICTNILNLLNRRDLLRKYIKDDCYLGQAAYLKGKRIFETFPWLTSERFRSKYPCVIMIASDGERSLSSFACLHPEEKMMSEQKLKKYIQIRKLTAKIVRQRFYHWVCIFKVNHLRELISKFGNKYEIDHPSKYEQAVHNALPLPVESGTTHIVNRRQHDDVDRNLKSILGELSRSEREMHEIFPVLNVKVQMLRSMAGNQKCECIVSSHPALRQFLYLGNLCLRLEGRECSYTRCSNKESRNGLIEKYKTCSECRFAHYCSRKCQKRDWKKGHKDQCKLLMV